MRGALGRPRRLSGHAAGLLALLLGGAGCELTDYFGRDPTMLCDQPGARRQVPCGPCGRGTQSMVCGQDRDWQREGDCQDNPYDVDQDGFASATCLEIELEPTCCGVLDCDDAFAERFPGALADLDGDDRYDTRCCDPQTDPRCSDCDDDDPAIWTGHGDRDRDGYDSPACGGTDCDDADPLRWWEHADIDGDGHTDARCCDPSTPFCDDCDDADPFRWSDHADLDGDGHDSVGCGGDDCDEVDSRRWTGHADVDGDGHVDVRCCVPDSGQACDDCNDNDPRRWAGNADLDGDGHDSGRCGGDDCDDDCATCLPGGERAAGEGRDHDCSGVVDEVEDRDVVVDRFALLSTVSETGPARAAAFSNGIVYVAAASGLHVVDVSDPVHPVWLAQLAVGDCRDVALWGELILLAGADGLFVVERSADAAEPQALTLLAGPVPTGDSRAVIASAGLALVAASEGLHLVDLSWPSSPTVVASLGGPKVLEFDRTGLPRRLFSDLRDVAMLEGLGLAVAAGSTPENPTGAIVVLWTGGRLDFYVYGTTELALPGATSTFSAPSPNGTAYASGRDGISRIIAASLSNFYPLTGVNAVWAPTIDPPNVLPAEIMLVAADTGLYLGGPRGYNDWEIRDHLDTGPARGLCVGDGDAFVATDEGLRIVGL